MSPIDAAIARWTPKIGREVGASDWVVVSQDMIDQFATATHDHQWIHVDPDRAAETPFGGTIAHGFLTLSLGSSFTYQCFPEEPGQVMGINYGLDHLRFVAPVLCGARLRGRFTLKNVTKRKPHEMLRQIEMTIDIEGQDTPALVADWLGLVIFDSK